MQRLSMRVLSFGITLLIITGCNFLLTRPIKPPVGSCILNLDAATPDQQAIRAVLSAEGELVVKQDINRLMALWADGAFVADANNTPTNRDDDEFWRNKDAIRHRYVRIVFPGAPSAATPADLNIKLTDDHAVVTATTQIGNEVSPAGDRWELIKTDHCWQIKSLTFNLEQNKSK